MNSRSLRHLASGGIAVLLASTLASPVHADEPVHGYSVSIKAFLADSFDTTGTYKGAPEPRRVARIHQSTTYAGKQIAATVSICASGYVNLGRFRLTGVPSNPDFRIKYSRASDGVDITAPVAAGTYRTARFDLGKCFRYRIDVIQTRAAKVGDLRTVSLSTNPEGPGWATLKAATHVSVGPYCDVIINGQPGCG